MQNQNNFLSAVELFHGLSNTELNVVAQSVNLKNYTAGEFLFKKGDPRKSIFIIDEGIVSLTGQDVFGNVMPLVTFGSTDFLGEGSLLDDDLHNTSASALIDSTIFSLDKRFFQEHGSITLKVFSNIARVISRRMQKVNAKILHSDGQYYSGKTRTEHDLLGYKEVPEADYYGVQTLRAVENFNITGVSISAFPHIIVGLSMVKKAAALANFDLGMIDEPVKNAIVQACDEIISGKYHNHFVVDMIQGGAGTSTNMNANEVIANRALEIMGRKKGDYEHCHPNNHVNLSQSTNDAYPTAVKLALVYSKDPILEALRDLVKAFRAKGVEFAHVIKMGRTQLQDAVPMTLGQEFEAWAVTLEEEIKRIEQNARLFLEINMGATAIGTGINADPEYSGLVVNYLRDISKLDLVLAGNLVEATQDTGAFIMFSSAIKRLAVKLSKISNDLRLLSSGPRAGFGEINLPPMQPGSSIMPGKVNPVIPEVVNQIAFKVIGNDLTVTLASEAGQLELNVMEPVIVQSLFENIGMLTAGMKTLQVKCIEGITANEEVCRGYVANSIGIVTALNPVLGYEKCSNLAKVALRDNRSVYDLVLENDYLTREELDEILKPENMLQSHKLSKK
jgi:aspartate ammonia-lyase